MGRQAFEVRAAGITMILALWSVRFNIRKAPKHMSSKILYHLVLPQSFGKKIGPSFRWHNVALYSCRAALTSEAARPMPSVWSQFYHSE